MKTTPQRSLNPWLDHVWPAPANEREDNHAKDALRLHLEREVTHIANRMVAEQRTPRHLATAYATNALVAQALEVQREASPEGYRNMLLSLATEDPALCELRAELGTAIRRRASLSFRFGVGAAMALAALAASFFPGGGVLAASCSAVALLFLCLAAFSKLRSRDPALVRLPG